MDPVTVPVALVTYTSMKPLRHTLRTCDMNASSAMLKVHIGR
jgi:hypothetical protein